MFKKVKKKLIIISAMVLILMNNLQLFASQTNISPWAQETVVEYLGDKFNSQTNYKEKINRQEFMELCDMVLTNIGYKFPEVKENPFRDTNNESVIKLVNAKLITINKAKNGAFGPLDTLRRQELALIIAQLFTNLDIPLIPIKEDVIRDNYKIVEAPMIHVVREVYQAGIMGVDGSDFNPDKVVTKEEAIVAISRVEEILKSPPKEAFNGNNQQKNVDKQEDIETLKRKMLGDIDHIGISDEIEATWYLPTKTHEGYDVKYSVNPANALYIRDSGGYYMVSSDDRIKKENVKFTVTVNSGSVSVSKTLDVTMLPYQSEPNEKNTLNYIKYHVDDYINIMPSVIHEGYEVGDPLGIALPLSESYEVEITSSNPSVLKLKEDRIPPYKAITNPKEIDTLVTLNFRVTYTMKSGKKVQYFAANTVKVLGGKALLPAVDIRKDMARIVYDDPITYPMYKTYTFNKTYPSTLDGVGDYKMSIELGETQGKMLDKATGEKVLVNRWRIDGTKFIDIKSDDSKITVSPLFDSREGEWISQVFFRLSTEYRGEVIEEVVTLIVGVLVD